MELSTREAAVLGRLRAAGVPTHFLEQLAEALEAPNPSGGDTIRAAFHRNRGRVTALYLSPERQVPLTERTNAPHNPE